MSIEPLTKRIRGGELDAFDDPELPLLLLVEPTADWFREGVQAVACTALATASAAWASQPLHKRSKLVPHIERWGAQWGEAAAPFFERGHWTTQLGVIARGPLPEHRSTALCTLPMRFVQYRSTTGFSLLGARLSLLTELIERLDTSCVGAKVVRAHAILLRYASHRDQCGTPGECDE